MRAATRRTAKAGTTTCWFAVRDALFGKDAFPMPEVPASIARPEIGRLMPQIDKLYEDWILLLMNVLMIEVRAEAFFSFCTNLMRSPDVFRDRRPAAMHAAELVERIRTDEAIHVAYLQAFVSEMRSFTIKGLNGERHQRLGADRSDLGRHDPLAFGDASRFRARARAPGDRGADRQASRRARAAGAVRCA